MSQNFAISHEIVGCNNKFILINKINSTDGSFFKGNNLQQIGTIPEKSVLCIYIYKNIIYSAAAF